jgi:Tfp pilus assembly protein PilV
VVRRRRAAGGFTLIEILVSLGLATVGLLGMVALQTVAIRGNATSRNFTEAVGIAQAQIEALQVWPYATLAAVNQTTVGNIGPTTPALYAPGSKATSEDIYSRKITVTAGAGMTSLLVDVSWPDADNLITHHVKLYTTRSP